MIGVAKCKEKIKKSLAFSYAFNMWSLKLIDLKNLKQIYSNQ
jgi:hypothetical protein